eukprot:TRINITY_DN83249_c0_g1_i1.p1 TRINITY_DN83249_c0_g1~~TRINITY_DN83249_c0_g1_i1.p1  ORF type:complete len:556 (-),score=73.49 TRINITY_DN83249_c0_g1_i1:75-1721(-)
MPAIAPAIGRTWSLLCSLRDGRRAVDCRTRCSGIFGPDLEVPATKLCRYEDNRTGFLDDLDEQLRDHSVASLVLDNLNAVAEGVLDNWHEEFRERYRSVPKGEWSQGGVGWLWPEASEMYAHPHYLVTVGDDDATSPRELPFRMQELLDGIREEALPVLESLTELGLDFAPGSLRGKMRMTKVIVHYYPRPTARETLLTHAAFHSDDSFFTLNFENTPGMHGLSRVAGSAAQIRRFEHSGLGTYPVNLFVGGFMQALSKGRWLSLIHSGSNPGPADRLSVTCFLGLPSLNGYASSKLGGTRGSQEGEVHRLLQESELLSSGEAGAKFSQIQGMYSVDCNFPLFYGWQKPAASKLPVRYSLVGSWDGWASFHELLQDAEDGGVFKATIVVPPEQEIEFQILCNGDWNQRIFPGSDLGCLCGPSSDGHGKNWKLNAPQQRSILRVAWDPRGTGGVAHSLEAMTAECSEATGQGTHRRYAARPLAFMSGSFSRSRTSMQSVPASCPLRHSFRRPSRPGRTRAVSIDAFASACVAATITALFAKRARCRGFV